MRLPPLPLLSAALTAAYFVFSLGVLAAFNLGLPIWLEHALSIVIAPAIVLLVAWNPVLRPLGMVSGEWVVGPNAWGCVLLIGAYSALAYLVAALINRRRRR